MIGFHVLFFYSVYFHPFSHSRSELLSTFFPSWIQLGRGSRDNFWLVPDAHPVLARFYPIHRVTAWIGAKLDLDRAFILLLYTTTLHHLWASFGWYLLLCQFFSPQVALFGTITFTYQAYHMKQQPCVVYTFSWLPWLLLSIQINSIIFSGVCFGMILLAGYYPIGIYSTLIAVCASVWWDNPLLWIPIGIVIGLVQLVPFLRYLPKTIRKAKSVPLKPGPWETNFYFGITPVVLLIINPQWRYLCLIFLMFLLPYLFRSILPRIYQRAWILPIYLSIFLCLPELALESVTALFILQSFDLWLHNSSLLPTRPWCELYQRPCRAFKSRLVSYLQAHLGTDRVSGLPYPLFTGLINNFNTLGYSGGMQLKLMAKWRGDTDPNGSGHHDYFRGKEDEAPLGIARCKFSYTLKKLNWPSTPIRHLYRNPNYGN